MDYNEVKSQVFSSVQHFLQSTPLVIWGSGATVACGLPSMTQLGEYIKATLALPINDTSNFEEELCRPEFEPLLDKIRTCIWNFINEADLKVREKIIKGGDEYLNAIASLMRLFCNNHPQVIKIITTNYDRVIENIAAWNGLSYADGSGLGDLTDFDSNRFKGQGKIKLVKVHGSLSWCKFFGSISPRVSNRETTGSEKTIIIPGNSKYKEAYNSPYRELIQLSDEYVRKASVFLVIGFGFNDQHITPKVTEKIANGTPVVIANKKPSKNTKDLLSKAKRYVMLSQDETIPTMTRIEYKMKDTAKAEMATLDGALWSLPGFMETLT